MSSTITKQRHIQLKKAISDLLYEHGIHLRMCRIREEKPGYIGIPTKSLRVELHVGKLDDVNTQVIVYGVVKDKILGDYERSSYDSDWDQDLAEAEDRLGLFDFREELHTLMLNDFN